MDETVAFAPMNGTIDDMMIYSRILSEAELLNSFCAREALRRIETDDQSALPVQCTS